MPVQQTETTRPWTFDTRAGAAYGLMTAAWYTVPDLVERRGTRALLKTACGVVGAAVLLQTSEGRQAIDGVRKVRGALRGTEGTDLPGTSAPWEQTPDDVPDNTLHDLTPVEIAPGGKVAIAVGAAVLLGATTAFAVVGEKGAYRWGERMRARGVRAPHLRVGLVLGAAAAALGGLLPAPEDD
ncbi:hypothetical protein ACFVQ3_05990 [Oerskovia sp. NPDC057915]|uniref:hypothetical protein n=1 Tax=Oerskovia sp. NPDC057915 TaxID=3346280 RepID=UPI0036DA3DE5